MIKRLTSKKEEQKKAKRNQLIIAIFLVGLMVLSTFGIIVNSFGKAESTNSIKYRGYTFKQSSGYYVLTIGENQFYFKSNISALDELKYESNYSALLTDYVGEPIYIDTTHQLSYTELYQNLMNYAQKIQFACIDEQNCPNTEAPIKTCQDNMIIIKESENNKIYQDQNCIFIEGNKDDLTKLTDKFLLKIIGIDQ